MKVKVRDWGGIDLIPENSFERDILERMWVRGCRVVSRTHDYKILLSPVFEYNLPSPPRREVRQADATNSS